MQEAKQARTYLGALILILLAVQPARADAGVPMIFFSFTGMVALLLPIIVIEGLYSARKLRLQLLPALKASALANLLSTLVGIPLTWLVLAGFEMIVTSGGRAYGLNSPIKKIIAVTVQAPWLIPYESDLYWMVPSAALVLLIPYFFVSYWLEARVTTGILSDRPVLDVRNATWGSNLVSYGLLFVGVSIWLLFSLTHPGSPP